MYHISNLVLLAIRKLILVFSIVILLFSSYLLLSLVFNLPTNFRTGPSSSTSIGDFNAGMPLKTLLSVIILDSSIYNIYTEGASQEVFHPNPLIGAMVPRDTTRTPIYSDTIRVKYHQLEEYDSTVRPINIATLTLNEATVYVRPKDYWHKMALGLPSILHYMMLGFIGLQMYRVLTAIHKSKFFDRRNYRIVASIGWALIVYNAIVYVLEKFQYSTREVYADFTSTIPKYRMLFDLRGQFDTNVSIPWLIVAAVILAIAHAFRVGYSLQKKERLTI